jgi:hypothetical protein
VLRHLFAAEALVPSGHQSEVCHQRDLVFDLQVLDETFPGRMRTDYFQVLPLVLEFPFPDLMRKDCYQVLEFQLVVLQAFQFLVQASSAHQ